MGPVIPLCWQEDKNRGKETKKDNTEGDRWIETERCRNTSEIDKGTRDEEVTETERYSSTEQ